MTGWCRALLAPGVELSDILALVRTTAGTATREPAAPDWPPAEHLGTVEEQGPGDLPLRLVEDRFILRRYVLGEAHAGTAAALASAAREGLVVPTSRLVRAARPESAGWAERGDTLYDLVAGCIDPGNEEVRRLWLERLGDSHPLVRLAAALTGPYLAGRQVLAALERTAGSDAEETVREAAGRSADVVRARAPA